VVTAIKKTTTARENTLPPPWRELKFQSLGNPGNSRGKGDGWLNSVPTNFNNRICFAYFNRQNIRIHLLEWSKQNRLTH